MTEEDSMRGVLVRAERKESKKERRRKEKREKILDKKNSFSSSFSSLFLERPKRETSCVFLEEEKRKKE